MYNSLNFLVKTIFCFDYHCELDVTSGSIWPILDLKICSRMHITSMSQLH